MKAIETSLIILPEVGTLDKDIWHQRWAKKLSTAYTLPSPCEECSFSYWVMQIEDALQKASKPVIFIAHGEGVLAGLLAARTFRQKVIGGFFVNPQPLRRLPFPEERLPYPSLVIASDLPSETGIASIKKLSDQWGALFFEAQGAGKINTESGHGPWPEGLLVFSQFLAKL